MPAASYSVHVPRRRGEQFYRTLLSGIAYYFSTYLSLSVQFTCCCYLYDCIFVSLRSALVALHCIYYNCKNFCLFAFSCGYKLH